ncbi:MAG TPA: hypothetical protein VNA24_18530 [Hyalangium sp.]|jgi:hypothetical protein|nr:hypothetical protein [Hyalangium sp.]
MNNDKKVFAFKLADKKEKETAKEKGAKWKAREGVSVAGCTDPTDQGNYRYGRGTGSDNGVWC